MYDRAKLLNGNPSPGQVCFQLSSKDDSLLPGDIDSTVPPPSTQDEFFIGSVAAVDNSHLSSVLRSYCLVAILGVPNGQQQL